MAITVTGNYKNAYENTYTSSKNENTKETGTSAAKKSSNGEYLKNLQKQVPYLKLQVGYGLNAKNDGKVNVVDINPMLLDKMQNDPKAATEYTQRLKDIEAATKWVDNLEKSMGCTAIVRHGYVDENGNFSSFAVVVKKDELNEKLRKEARENTEEWIERSREKVRENAEKLAEKSGKRAEEANSDNDKTEKAKKLLADKLKKAKGGLVLLDNDDMRKVIEAAREQEKRAAEKKGDNATATGTYLDMHI